MKKHNSWWSNVVSSVPFQETRTVPALQEAILALVEHLLVVWIALICSVANWVRLEGFHLKILTGKTLKISGKSLIANQTKFPAQLVLIEKWATKVIAQQRKDSVSINNNFCNNSNSWISSVCCFLKALAWSLDKIRCSNLVNLLTTKMLITEHKININNISSSFRNIPGWRCNLWKVCRTPNNKQTVIMVIKVLRRAIIMQVSVITIKIINLELPIWIIMKLCQSKDPTSTQGANHSKVRVKNMIRINIISKSLLKTAILPYLTFLKVRDNMKCTTTCP